MTREEAIEVIEQDIPCEYDTDLIEALNMAINALEHPERNVVTVLPCGDTISRQAVIDVIEREQFKGDAVSEIEKLPPVTPERPKGEWVKYSIPRCGEQHYKCSHCDEYVNFGLYGDFYTKDFIYCPHCGADMRGVSECSEENKN